MASLASQVVATLLDLKRAGQYKQALALVDQTMRDQIGPSLDLAHQLSAADLILMLKSGLALDVQKALFLATLLEEEGDILAAENSAAASRQAYLKSLQVALEALDGADEATSREQLPLIEELANQLGPSGIDSDTRDLLAEYYRKIGESKRARKWLSGLSG